MWAWTGAQPGGGHGDVGMRIEVEDSLGVRDVKLMSKAVHVHVRVHVCAHGCEGFVWSLGKEGGARRGKAIE